MKNDHYAIDLVAKKGTKIKSILEGTVILSDWNPKTGYVIGIQHPNNFISFYKHCSRLLKQAGDVVTVGEYIAIIGNSGELSTGPHLHLELWKNGVPLNPESYIAF
jgi:murein DD-endopeptidase MepM/ murein hydrolase activator NlpD